MTVKAVWKADTCRLFESLFKYRDLSLLMCQLFGLGTLSEASIGLLCWTHSPPRECSHWCAQLGVDTCMNQTLLFDCVCAQNHLYQSLSYTLIRNFPKLPLISQCSVISLTQAWWGNLPNKRLAWWFPKFIHSTINYQILFSPQFGMTLDEVEIIIICLHS